MLDEEIQAAARDAIQNRDLAAWHRVHRLLVQAGASEDPEATRERIESAKAFLGQVAVTEAAPGWQPRSGRRADGALLRTQAQAMESLAVEPHFERWPGPGGTPREEMSAGDVVLALDLAFGIAGWDLLVERVDVGEPQRSEASALWNVSASAVVTLVIRVAEGEGVRRDIGMKRHVGQARSDLAADAVKRAVSDAFKRAASSLGPATGLLLKFPERQRADVLRRWRQGHLGGETKHGDQAG